MDRIAAFRLFLSSDEAQITLKSVVANSILLLASWQVANALNFHARQLMF
jgi:hypothetical protein